MSYWRWNCKRLRRVVGGVLDDADAHKQLRFQAWLLLTEAGLVDASIVEHVRSSTTIRRNEKVAMYLAGLQRGVDPHLLHPALVDLLDDPKAQDAALLLDAFTLVAVLDDGPVGAAADATILLSFNSKRSRNPRRAARVAWEDLALATARTGSVSEADRERLLGEDLRRCDQRVLWARLAMDDVATAEILKQAAREKLDVTWHLADVLGGISIRRDLALKYIAHGAAADDFLIALSDDDRAFHLAQLDYGIHDATPEWIDRLRALARREGDATRVMVLGILAARLNLRTAAVRRELRALLSTIESPVAHKLWRRLLED